MTYPQWRSWLIKDRRDRYDCSAAYGIVPQDWLDRHTWPRIKQGETLPLPVVRSMAKHCGRPFMVHVQKHFPSAFPGIVDLSTGRKIR